MTEAYRELEVRFARHAAIGEAVSMLHWDMSTMMPAGGSEARAEQLAALYFSTLKKNPAPAPTTK